MNCQVYSNMPLTEEWRINGFLSEKSTERAIDASIKAEKIDETLETVRIYNKEAQGSFVAEDFLSDQIKSLELLVKNMRGNNREVLLDLIEEIKEAKDEAVREAEYGSSELHKALREINDFKLGVA